MPEFASVIELSSLDGTNGFQINGEFAEDRLGGSVASAGDVNGDGFADLIIGAYGADPNGEYSGAAYVVFGGASGFPADLELSSLNGSNGFQINGEGANNLAGISVASAGDVNGDGFADMIVGARTAGPGGASYVVFGKASGFSANLELSSLDGTNGFQINGETIYDSSGFSVASAGDINGDGFADLVIGAYAADPNGSSSGASYVIFGKASGFSANLDLSALDGSNGFQINGEAAQDISGFSVASAGDINGDGFADIIIGAKYADPNGQQSGASYVVFGKASGFSANLELSALDGSNGIRINGEAAYDNAGFSVASAGDINGDGFADMVIGAAGAGGSASGASYVVFGKPGGFGSSLDLASLNGTNGFQIGSEGAYDRTGFSVAAAGDVNGDGFGDLIVSAPFASPNGFASGASYVVFGKASGFAANLDPASLDGNNGFQISGEFDGGQSGFSVAAAGDINGDGFADLIVGSHLANPSGGREGAVHVIFGHRAFTSVERIGTDFAQTISGGFGDDTVAGRGGDDKLRGFEGSDIMQGGDGNDTIGGGDGDDNVFGDAGNDLVHGGLGDNFVSGGDGDDRIVALSGNDTLAGGNGNDTLLGGLGDDFASGGAGNDLFLFSGGNDSVAGGSGTDTLSFITVRGSAGISASLATGVATSSADTITFSSIERLEGTIRADVLTGDDLSNTLTGQAGNDSLSGGGGRDILVGGRNGDILTGGEGNDVFDFDALFESTAGKVNRDVITDFDTNGDVIDLLNIDAIAGGADDAFAFIGTAAFTDVGQVRVFQQGGNTFIDVNASGDTRADMRIELTGLVALDAADFIL